jgi:hypothetical protein
VLDCLKSERPVSALEHKCHEEAQMTVKLVKTAAGIALLAGVLGSAGPAFAASGPTMPTGGPVRVWVTPKGANGVHGTILIVGAIGDWGTTLNINANGTTDPNGNYAKITLQKGTFEVNLTTINAISNKAQPTFYAGSCSALFSAKGPIGLLDGTGDYKGISGTLIVTETFALIMPRYSSGAHIGQCNMSNSAQPAAEDGAISASGNVGFS